ncbi:uncharacterized protein LOC110731955 [Chenopodium quinoa]|uniref:uncharacterized protein LOC110731955 n=1 Tax=Chenopodium quinoa TaxID=63459 RepID=UPI000B77F478|nr:uncharacterized protein LOC110731955 [Chenopodium quinoa]
MPQLSDSHVRHLNEDFSMEEVRKAVFDMKPLKAPGSDRCPPILKEENASRVELFRPIGLCNTIYKVISKCLVNRLKPILGEFIGEFHNAFFLGRLITDSAMMGHELIQCIKGRRKKDGIFAGLMKENLNKSYDKIRWDFINSILRQMAFPERWIQWIDQCITTVRYTVLVNVDQTEWFSPSAGL